MSKLADTDANRLWALRGAALPTGFTSRTDRMFDYMQHLWYRGYVCRHGWAATWNITAEGKQELARLERMNNVPE